MATDIEEDSIAQEGRSENFIRSWLQGVEGPGLGGGRRASPPSNLRLLDRTCPTKEEKPGTPNRYLLPALLLDDEPSPTNTFFSDATLFDHDRRQNQGEDGDDGDDDNASASSIDTTPVAHCKPGTKKEPVTNNFVLGVESLSGFRSLSTRSEGTAQSLNSYEPPTEIGESFDVSRIASFVATQAPHHPDKERAVIIVSCLQCTLLNLPCSRTLPSCSRCERNGHAQLCLTQRMRLCEETIMDDGMRVSDPVLLHIKGEEDSLWLTKLYVRDQKWQDEQNRKNWVFPVDDGNYGGYWRCGNRYAGLKHHPGEGIGRKIRMLLRLEWA